MFVCEELFAEGRGGVYACWGLFANEEEAVRYGLTTSGEGMYADGGWFRDERGVYVGKDTQEPIFCVSEVMKPQISQSQPQPMPESKRKARAVLTEMGHGGTRGPQPDYSQQPGNPTSELQAKYQQLMTIQDPHELVDAAVGIVQPLVGRGMSEKNWRIFQRNIQGAARRGLVGLQMFLSNYILKGGGQGVIGSGGGRFESVDVIANMITEDVDIFNELTPQQQYLKNLVESCTNFKVVLL